MFFTNQNKKKRKNELKSQNKRKKNEPKKQQTINGNSCNSISFVKYVNLDTKKKCAGGGNPNKGGGSIFFFIIKNKMCQF